MKTKSKSKIKGKLTLKNFKGHSKCYDRKTQSNLAIIDTHLHMRPFGGKAISFNKLLSMLKNLIYYLLKVKVLVKD